MMGAPTPLVVLPPVTVLIGLNVAGGILVAADRGTAREEPNGPHEGQDLGPERCKVTVNFAGVALGMAGVIAVPTIRGTLIDLLSEANALCSAHTSPVLAAAAVHDLFIASAATFRGHAANVGTGSFAPVPLSRPVLTVAIVAGLSTISEPAMFVIGLTTEGPVELHTVSGAGVAFAPPSCQADVESILLDSTNLSSHYRALVAAGERITHAAAAAPAWVSTSWDHVEVTPSGGVDRAHHPHRMYLPRT
jgi:hypothetical protein